MVLFGWGEKKDPDEDISYARSRLLALHSFYNISKKDAAVLWSALNHIDKHKNEVVHIATFASMFCPKSKTLFEKMYDKYCFVPKGPAFKTAAEPVGNEDDATVDMSADELIAHMAKSEADQAAAKSKFDEALRKKKEKEMHERHRPDFVKFLNFFLFFMSVQDEEMPIWVYWLWFHLPRVKPSKENIHALVGNIWDPENFNVAWYDGEVKYIVKVVDPSFNARTFQLTDQRTGGAWSVPFHEMRAELYQNFERVAYFERIRTGFLQSMNHLEISMMKMKDLQLKGAPEDRTHRGDRSQARHDIRTFVHHYHNYARMPIDEVETFSEGNCCATISTMIKELLKRVFRPCINAWEKVAPKDIELDLGLGTEGYARPKSRGTLSKLKKEIEEKEGRSPDKASAKLTKEEEDADALATAEAEREEERRRLVPLEYKYRKQLVLPARVLNHKAIEMRAHGKRLVSRVKMEVVSEAEILSNFDLDDMFKTSIDIEPLDDESATEASFREDDDEESAASFGSRLSAL